MKLFIPKSYHHKNQNFLNYYANFYTIVNNIEDSEIIFSSDEYFPIEKYPNKKFIFGPHFCIAPNNIVKSFNNKYNNAIYILPSKQCINVWKNYYKYDILPLTYCPFGVDTKKFTPTRPNRDEIIVYYKRRHPEELDYVLDFLKKEKIRPKIFKYGCYNETEYFNQLRKTKLCIWIGTHESQGFALQECLSMNVPLLVWNTSLMKQEYGSKRYDDINIKMQTIPYWDERCGEYFFKKEQFPEYFQKIVKNINNYNPRQFVLENLSMEVCKKKWDNLISTFFSNISQN